MVSSAIVTLCIVVPGMFILLPHIRANNSMAQSIAAQTANIQARITQVKMQKKMQSTGIDSMTEQRRYKAIIRTIKRTKNINQAEMEFSREVDAAKTDNHLQYNGPSTCHKNGECEIKLSGRYIDILHFLQQIYKSSSIVRLQNIQLKEGTEQISALTGSPQSPNNAPPNASNVNADMTFVSFTPHIPSFTQSMGNPTVPVPSP